MAMFKSLFNISLLYLPLVHLNKSEPPLPKVGVKFGWNGSSDSGEKDENIKVLQRERQERRTTEKSRLDELIQELLGMS